MSDTTRNAEVVDSVVKDLDSHSQEIVVRGEESLPAQMDTSWPMISDEQIAVAERAIENVRRARQIALRITTPKDWCDMGGEPYLQASGCDKVASLFGISFTSIDMEEKKRRVGTEEVIQYVCRVKATWFHREMWVEGISSTQDKFFGQKNGEKLPLEEVDLNSLRKKALTNAQSRAIKKLLGLGGLTWDEVKGAGHDRQQTAGVDYGRSKANRAASKDDGKALDRLQQYLTDLAEWDSLDQEQAVEPLDLLRAYSAFDGDRGRVEAKSWDQIGKSKGWLGKTLDKAEKAWKSHPANGGEG